MMFMTAKVDLKKILMILAAVAAIVLGLILLFGGKDTAQTAAPNLSGNDGRVQFLTELGWEVTQTPVESTQVKIPAEASEVFDRYNLLQQGQGYDLSRYAGKKVMRYVYTVTNYPGASAPVYATLLVYKNKIIGGDITDTGAKGVIQGFKKQEAATMPTTIPTAPPAETAPPTETAATPSK